MEATMRLKELFSSGWSTGHSVVALHIGAALTLPFYFWLSPPGWGVVAVAIFLTMMNGFGVTAGYHRCFAHRSFKPRRFTQALIVGCASLSFQGSIIKWSHDHRIHHAFTDNDRDPYNITKGWWNAHLLWMFNPPIPFDPRLVADLTRNALLRFQNRHHFALSLASTGFAILLGGMLTHDYLGVLMLGCVARLIFTLNATWFVNSASHAWGERTFSKDVSAVDNFVLAPISLGEGGYHNYHHVFPSDSRNSYRWFHPDPTKWFLWILEKLNLARDLKRTDKLTIHRRLIREDEKLLLMTLSKQMHEKCDEWRRVIRAKSAALQNYLDHISTLRKEAKHSQARKLYRQLRRELRAWHRLSREVLNFNAV